jgi:N6-adenosine-specific RNA methylase IME4
VKYGTIIADPPWLYSSASRNDRKNRGYVTYRSGVGGEYDTLTTSDLCALPVGELASHGSVLLLWTTGPFIPHALEVVKAWGFEFKTLVYWGKVKADRSVHGGGVGYWFRGACEPVVVASRGKSYRTMEPGLYLSGKTSHSCKPGWLHEVAERHFPGPRLELFGRGLRPGWTVLGDETPGDGKDIRVSVGELLAGGDGEEAA